MRASLALLVLSGCDLTFGLPTPGHNDDTVDAKPPTIDAPVASPDGPHVTPRTCKEAMSQGVMADGLVTIDPDGDAGPNAPFQVYCDQTTSGGGWTLVWAYGFTDYAGFTNGNNAVSPRPDWGLPGSGGTLISTTVPTGPTSNNAMPFAQWKDVGTEILVTSTINQWVHCTPGNGSLVTLTAGSMTCTVEKVIVNQCTTTVPNNLVMNGTGPSLNVGGAGNNYYYWDGATGSNWPTHDPCGQNQGNQLKNVPDPGGAIYVR